MLLIVSYLQGVFMYIKLFWVNEYSRPDHAPTVTYEHCGGELVMKRTSRQMA